MYLDGVGMDVLVSEEVCFKRVGVNVGVIDTSGSDIGARGFSIEIASSKIVSKLKGSVQLLRRVAEIIRNMSQTIRFIFFLVILLSSS